MCSILTQLRLHYIKGLSTKNIKHAYTCILASDVHANVREKRNVPKMFKNHLSMICHVVTNIGTLVC